MRNRGMGCAPALLLCVLGVATRATGAPVADVPVLVRETAGVSLPAWPVTVGVPFPRGQLRSDTIQVTSGNTPLPAQSRVLGRWADGSVRWLLVDTQVDLKPQQISELRIASGSAPASGLRPGLRLQESEDAIRVDTGPLQFRVAKRAAGLLHDIRRDGKPVTAGPLTCFLTLGHQRHECRPPTSVRILEGGPWRARLELRGEYDSEFSYITRIDAYAGHPYLRILHTFEQRGARAVVEVAQIGLDLPLAFAAAPAYRAGIEAKAPLAAVLPAAGLRLLQIDEESYQIGDEPRRGRATGWASLHGGEHGIAVSGRDFWQEYPKSIELRRDRLVYNLWAPDSGPAQVGSGAAKTHELVLYFATDTPPAPGLLMALASPVLGHVDAVHTARSQALRNAIAPSPDTKVFLKQLDDAYRRYRQHADRETWDDRGAATCSTGRERPRRGFYGMWNWGDWNFPGYHDNTKGCDAWGNLEYDLPQVLGLAFAASGQPRHADGMTAAARHFMDVDTIHDSGLRPQWAGMNHPKNPLHFTFEFGGVDLGHTWNEGLLTYYFLTGDERALATARGIADHLVTRLRRGIVKGNPRQWGWPQVALVAMYEATGDDIYRRAALDYARGALAAHAPQPITHWKTGILAEALAYTHSIAAPGKDADQILSWLRRYAAAVLAHSSSPDPRYAPALAYVGRLEQRPEYLAAARRSVDRLGFGHWGKPLTIAGRTGFAVLGSLEPYSPHPR